MKKIPIVLWLALAALLMLGCTKKSSEKEILSFRFVSPNIEAVAMEDGKTLVATVPIGTDVTNLMPIILVSEKATINPGSGEPMDFSNPVSYVVTAEDGSQAVYKVVVIVKPLSTEKRILYFGFENLEVEAAIDENLKKVEAAVPWGTDVTTLVPVITVSERATVNPASGVTTDFTDPVTYTVTAEDGSQALYTTIVTMEGPDGPNNNEKRILSFRFEALDIDAEINEELKRVEAIVPWGTDVTTLVPVITVSERATINPASGVTTDFTNPVTYTVTAEDGSQAYYTAIVSVGIPNISEQSFVGIWGVEKAEYYNIDYAGNPIAASMETYFYNPFDENNSIRFVFRADGTGEMRDSAIDTIYTNYDEEHEVYLDTISCPDTVMIYTFTYSFDNSSQTLYVNMEGVYRPYRLVIRELTDDSFVYENEYGANYVEKAYLKRLSYTPTKSTGEKSQFRPREQGSLLGKR